MAVLRRAPRQEGYGIVSNHRWEVVGDEIGRAGVNIFGFKWLCFRCGSVSGQKEKPSSLATRASPWGPLDCDETLIYEVMSS